MASKHDFNYPLEHSRSLYNAKGQPFACHSKEDELRAKELGFTSVNYVRSEWPKTAYQKKTGLTRTVGKLENTDEQNAAAVAALGPDWGLEHVHAPEPVDPKAAAQTAASADTMALLAVIMGQMTTMQKRLDENEAALLETAAALEAAKKPAQKKPEPAA